MSLIKRNECKTKADYRVVICPNCGARIEIKTMERRYMVSLLFLVVIFASIIYLNRNIAPTFSTSLSSSQPKSVGVIEKKVEAEKVEAEAPEKAKAEAAALAKVEALKAKVATQGAEAEQAKLAIKQKVNRNWMRPSSTTAGSRCTIRVRLMSDGAVIDAEVISSSGDEDFDRSAENAVNKASPLPVPKDKELFAREFRSFQFLFDPK
ncbi:MAG: cell envelope integrity protein TolA [Methylococcaceae bacterium]|jgi:TonB family protein